MEDVDRERVAALIAEKRRRMAAPDWQERRERQRWIAQCRTDLTSWSIEALKYQDLRPARHHRLLISKLELVASGKLKRLIVEMPPGSAKSTYCSQLFPAWMLQRKRRHRIIGASHTTDLALDFSDKIQSLVLENEEVLSYGLRTEQKQRWYTTNGGAYLAAGVGSAIPGFRADLGIIDDPVKSRQSADSDTDRKRVWDWYLGSFERRLTPGAPVIVIACMTGDTPVTMADGTWRRLNEISIGDSVLSYQDGSAVSRRVLNKCCQGDDEILEIRTGHSTVRCNARHPFLVFDGTKRQADVLRLRGHPVFDRVVWRRASDLVVGDRIVTNCSIPSVHRRISKREAWLLGFMFGDGWITYRDRKRREVPKYTAKDGTVRYYAPTEYPCRNFVTSVALSLDEVMNECVLGAFDELFGCRPIVKGRTARFAVANVGRWFLEHGLTGRAKTKRVPSWMYGESIDVRLEFLRGFNAADGYIASRGPNKGRWSCGLANRLLVQDIRHLARGVGFAVSNMHNLEGWRQAPSSPVPTWFEGASVAWGAERSVGTGFYFSAVRSVKPAGRDLVYDIQVDGAENFIADGLVVHNTRWHEDDLIGRLLETRPDEWEVLRLPAEAEEDDPLDRLPGEWLWSDDDYGYGAELADIKQTLVASGATREWASQYQQRPRPADGAIFRTNMISVLEAAPVGESVRAYDFAATEAVGSRDPDWTRGVRLTKTDIGRYVVTDVVGCRGGPDEVEHLVVSTAYSDGKRVRIGIPQDPGQAGKVQVLYLTRKLSGFTVESSPETGDKATRAAPVASQVNVGNVDVVKGSWNKSFLDELAAFPAGAKKDQVDALSRAFSMLVESGSPFVLPPEVLSRVRASGRDRFTSSNSRLRNRFARVS